MRSYVRWQACAIVIALAMTSAAIAESRPQFHPPQTEAEKALDRILQLDQSDPSLVSFAVGSFQEKEIRTAEFPSLFTPALLKAWRQHERDTVQQECAGVYKDGVICGMDINPISCATGENEGNYLYRTIEAGKTRAVISSSHHESAANGPRYYLVKVGRLWALDGVSCPAAEFRFNVKDAGK